MFCCCRREDGGGDGGDQPSSTGVVDGHTAVPLVPLETKPEEPDNDQPTRAQQDTAGENGENATSDKDVVREKAADEKKEDESRKKRRRSRSRSRDRRRRSRSRSGRRDSERDRKHRKSR